MKPKFIYWFTFYNLASPTVRYRGRYPLEFLKNNYGINSYFVYPSYRLSNILHFVKAYFSALLFPKKNSLIVFQSINSNFIYSNALKLLARVRKNQSFYDLDDADYLRFKPDTIFYFIRNCSRLTVGSTELLKNLTKLNSNTTLITCPVPDLDIVKRKRNELFTIGWIGDFGTGHKESLLKLFFPSLLDLPFKVKLILLGVGKKTEYDFLTAYFKSFENVTVEIPQDIVWTDETDIQQRIATFDVGIATLLDTEFYRSKSAFKMKQCFNNGVPVLSSDIAENNLFLEHGKTGFFCKTPAEFAQRIIELKKMSDDEYATLSANARATIHRFNLKKFSEDLISTYELNATNQC
jgi:glycosyltransferase involved in cell wall biosynthesis